jgi:hypothetical protein
LRVPTGHVFRVERARGPVWYAKYRLPDGRQVQKKLGPAWTERGRPTAGYFTKRLAEAWLRTTLEQARRGVLPGMVRTGATFADAAAEWLRYVEHDRRRKPSTVAGYESIWVQVFWRDLRGLRDDTEGVAWRVDAVVVLGEVKVPVGVEVAVADQGA